MTLVHRVARVLTAAALLGFTAAGQPPLTTIQDVLFKADGKRFNGIVHISWATFEAQGPSTVPQQNRSVRVIDGHLFVQLTPTAGATPAAYYDVKYWSDGHVASSERWGVPQSTAAVKVRDVRLGDPIWPPGGGASGGTGISLPINESDVTGLVEDLSQRPEKGPGFTPGRAAVISSSGAIESSVGTPGDCVRVDGTSAPCATGGTLTFVDQAAPAGSVNGVNAVFTLPSSPVPAQSLLLFRGGVMQRAGIEYSLAGATVTFGVGLQPLAGETLTAYYRTTGVGSVPQFIDATTPAGSINGVNQVFTLPVTPFPASSLQMYRNGLMAKAGIDFTLAGTTVTFLPGAVPQSGDSLSASFRW